MSKYIVEFPDEINLVRGFIIPKDFEGMVSLALSQAVEVVEVDADSMQYYGETENGKIHDKDGLHVKLFAMNVEEGKK
jgi:hypothetical protein